MIRREVDGDNSTTTNSRQAGVERETISSQPLYTQVVIHKSDKLSGNRFETQSVQLFWKINSKRSEELLIDCSSIYMLLIYQLIEMTKLLGCFLSHYCLSVHTSHYYPGCKTDAEALKLSMKPYVLKKGHVARSKLECFLVIIWCFAMEPAVQITRCMILRWQFQIDVGPTINIISELFPLKLIFSNKALFMQLWLV